MAGIGPQLPPHLMKKNTENVKDEKSQKEYVGPALPPYLKKSKESSIGPSQPSFVKNDTQSIGPLLPPHLRKSQESNDDDDDSPLGPASSSMNVQSTCESKSYGPALPPGMGKRPDASLNANNKSEISEDDGYDDEDDDEIVGPLLPSFAEEASAKSVAEEFEERASAMRNKLTGKAEGDGPAQRENWMLELPPEFSKNFGMGPRTFRSKAVDCGDRSVWTDTPADKERKRMERQQAAMAGEKRKQEKAPAKVPTKEELEMQSRVQQYNTATRPQSLLEMHQTKKKKTDEEAGDKVRRPFDRERDLNLRQKDPKATQKFIKDAKGFGSKFSTGSYENKFL
ncbi:GPALPP motifs-containing protein 1-like [Clytia hemisphaerica]|uniref:DUF3752 domain-containing protein n=1 Tax=Clytia hemisphaerica TaxID=252671 RepID=A0A7M5XIW7_9CNID